MKPIGEWILVLVMAVLAAIIAGQTPTHAQAVRSFQYKIIELPGMPASEIVLNTMGGRGWEVVAFDGSTVILKRPQ